MAIGTVTLPNTASVTTLVAPPVDTDTVTIVRKDGTTYQRRRRGTGSARVRSRSKAALQTFYVFTDKEGIFAFTSEAETLAFVENPRAANGDSLKVARVIKGVTLKVSMKAALTVA